MLQGGEISVDMVWCDLNMAHFYSLVYDKGTDGKLYDAAIACNDPLKQEDKAACEAVAV